MSLPKQASIRARTKESEWRFDWHGFDGDDCFESFQITVVEAGQTQRFDFGPCVVRGLRKLTRCFRGAGEDRVEGGFRNPDIRYYEVLRSPGQYHLTVRFDGSGLHRRFTLSEPELDLETDFINQYDSPET